MMVICIIARRIGCQPNCTQHRATKHLKFGVMSVDERTADSVVSGKHSMTQLLRHMCPGLEGHPHKHNNTAAALDLTSVALPIVRGANGLQKRVETFPRKSSDRRRSCSVRIQHLNAVQGKRIAAEIGEIELIRQIRPPGARESGGLK